MKTTKRKPKKKKISPNYGGKREGAGRKKGEPNGGVSLTIKQALKDSLDAKFGSKVVTTLAKDYLAMLDNVCVGTKQFDYLMRKATSLKIAEGK